MKTKKVSRYYCDFCGKGGCGAGHMKKHERGCTLNPDRQCGLCALFEEGQVIYADLDAALNKDIVAGGEGVMKLENLRDASRNCPLCILSTLRLSKENEGSMENDFNFKNEIDAFWADYNADQRAASDAENMREIEGG